MQITPFDLFFFVYVFVTDVLGLIWIIKSRQDAKREQLRIQAIETEIKVLKKEVRDMLMEVSDRLEIAIERQEEPAQDHTLRAVSGK